MNRGICGETFRIRLQWARLPLLLVLFLSLPLAAFGQLMTQAHTVEEAISDGYSRGHSNHALWLPGISRDFIFGSDSAFIEYSDGSAHLSGTVRSRSHGDRLFEVDVWLGGRTEVAPPGSPKKELRSSAYVDRGGPVDPATWAYYTSLDGSLTGRGSFSGALVSLARRGPALQVGYGANGKNIQYGAASWIDWQVIDHPDGDPFSADSGRGDFNLELNLEYCADASERDSDYGLYQGGHALSLPGIGPDFVFDGAPGSLLENSDGVARLVGTVRRGSDPSQAFEIDIELTGYTRVAPPGSPKKELDSSAYVENGGPVDTSTWWYYRDFTGTLSGIDSYAGAVLEVTRTGAAFQAGVGANGKNIRRGASSWFHWVVTQQPFQGHIQASGQGDINIDLDNCICDCVGDAEKDLDYKTGWHNNKSMELRQIARDLILSNPDRVKFREYGDGTARLVGRFHSKSNPAMIFDLNMVLTDRHETARANSPKKELPEMAYGPMGPVETSQWWYYGEFEGTMVGRGDAEGAIIRLTRRGPAFQFGDGANNKNTIFGGTGWLDYHVEEYPTNGSGANWPTNGIGDGRFDLGCVDSLEVDPFPGECQAVEVVRYKAGSSGHRSGKLELERMDATKALGIPEGDDSPNFVSLGYGGGIILRFEQAILNQRGPMADFRVVNTTFGGKDCSQYPERVQVEASRDGIRWELLVQGACQDFDLDLGRLRFAHYLRITDMTDRSLFFLDQAADGFDLDGVVGFSCN